MDPSSWYLQHQTIDAKPLGAQIFEKLKQTFEDVRILLLRPCEPIMFSTRANATNSFENLDAFAADRGATVGFEVVLPDLSSDKSLSHAPRIFPWLL
jgi:hypothetical protein